MSEKKTCKWTYDEWHDVYETECGQGFCLEAGKIDDNDFRYCPYCGGVIEDE